MLMLYRRGIQLNLRMNFKKIFITGGAGYAGSCLVPELLNKGYEVTVYDIMYYTDEFLPKNNPSLKIIKGDIRDEEKIKTSCQKHDVFIHLACISNDTSFALDEELSTSINLDAFEPMVVAAKDAGIKRFIYASSSSVYGISEEKNVTEEHPLVPLTLYNKYKGICEFLSRDYSHEIYEDIKKRNSKAQSKENNNGDQINTAPSLNDILEDYDLEEWAKALIRRGIDAQDDRNTIINNVIITAKKELNKSISVSCLRNEWIINGRIRFKL